jgi:hypothetical protein
MTDPRRPDEPQLSTADLAAASERTVERDVTRESQRANANVLADAPVREPVETSEDHSTPLFAGNESDDFRHRWTDIQAAFVDEPRQAVEKADGLVAEAMKRLAEIFARERGNLEQQWSKGGDVSTEDLRVALRRYRSFFDRLLSI